MIGMVLLLQIIHINIKDDKAEDLWFSSRFYLF